MTRTLHIDHGINGAFITRRWERPENWMRLTAEAGYKWHSFCGDVIDPFFSGDKTYQMQAALQTREAAERYGVQFCDIYTGVATHRFHGLSHHNESVRARMCDWIIECMDIALMMGAPNVGGHWDAISVEVLEKGGDALQEVLDRTRQQFRSLSVIAKEKGLRSLSNEQMYIPSEVPWTIQGAYDFLEAVNANNPTGVPVYITLDTGHMAGMHYGLDNPEDLDYLAWLRHFAPVAEVIHLNQTTPDASKHWPFNDEFNEKGCVSIQDTLDAMKEGHERWNDNPLSKIMEPVEQTILINEYIPGSTTTEERVLRDITESAEHVAKFIPEGGMDWEFE